MVQIPPRLPIQIKVRQDQQDVLSLYFKHNYPKNPVNPVNKNSDRIDRIEKIYGCIILKLNRGKESEKGE